MATEARLRRPLDVASLAAFRIGFGALLLVAALRYLAHGWIAEYFLKPSYFFKYWAFEWVRPWPGTGMYWHFGAMAACALGVLLGYRYRACIVGFGLLFAYAHLIDKTNYLNHYYLVVCVCVVMACLPLNAAWSFDARRDPSLRHATLPAWMSWTLRAQFGLVYFFGGVAKLNADWLLRAEPLSLWLARKVELPVLGELLATRGAAFALSWAGALFDLCIVPLLLWSRSRPFAFMALVVFHALTAQLFSIGMFPYLMICGATLFFEANWPRRVLAKLRRATADEGDGKSENESSYRNRSGRSGAFAGERWGLPAMAVYLAVQVLVPMRSWLYPGDVRWTEQGFRFSWNVMLMEKNGVVDFRVVEPSTGRTFQASPRDYFTPYQLAMLAPQPDMLLEAARIVAADYRARGVKDPAVYADAFASLNGRPTRPLVDPTVDLAREVDGFSNKTWILPMTSEPQTRVASLPRSLR